MPDDTREPIASGDTKTEAKVEMTPELVQDVTDRVWQLWKRDLNIERERYRPIRQPFLRQGGP